MGKMLCSTNLRPSKELSQVPQKLIHHFLMPQCQQWHGPFTLLLLPTLPPFLNVLCIISYYTNHLHVHEHPIYVCSNHHVHNFSMHPLSPCFILHNYLPISTTHLVWDKKHLQQCNVHGSIQLLGDRGTCASYLLLLENESDVINHYNIYDIPVTIH